MKKGFDDLLQQLEEQFEDSPFVAATDDGSVDGFDGVTIAEFNADMKICNLKEFQSKIEYYYPYGKDNLFLGG